MIKYMLESALNFTNWVRDSINNIQPHNYDNHHCFKDLPTNTKNDWINRQNAKLNQIPLCKKANV